MPERVSCPKCQSQLDLPDDSRGREIRCPACAGIFVHGAPTDSTSQPRLSAAAPTEVQPGMPDHTRPRWQDADEVSGDELADRIRKRGDFRSGAGLALAVRVLLGLN